MDAALVHEVDDHLHLVVDLEVGELLGVASLGQGLETGLDHLDEAAAEHGLFAKEVLLGLILEGRLDDAGASAAQAPSVGKGDIPGVTGGVLVHAGQVGHTGALGVLTTNDVAGALGGDHDDVDVLGSLDVAKVDVETVSEAQGVARLQVGLHELLVDGGLGLVGGEDHDDVGFLGGGGHVGHLEAGLASLVGRRGALTQADAHVAAGVHEVECMSVALGAIADDGNLLALDDAGIAILLVVNGYCHVVCLLKNRW